jgi:hypothetical protein
VTREGGKNPGRGSEGNPIWVSLEEKRLREKR